MDRAAPGFPVTISTILQTSTLDRHFLILDPQDTAFEAHRKLKNAPPFGGCVKIVKLKDI